MATTKKATSKPKKKMGRKPKEISKETFEKLCYIQCTESEICSVLQICEDTLNAWCKRTYDLTFSDAYKKYSENGKMSLRRMQFKLAQKYPAMAIFLGKQYLGQRDVVEQNDNAKIEVVTEVPEDD